MFVDDDMISLRHKRREHTVHYSYSKKIAYVIGGVGEEAKLVAECEILDLKNYKCK